MIHLNLFYTTFSLQTENRFMKDGKYHYLDSINGNMD